MPDKNTVNFSFHLTWELVSISPANLQPFPRYTLPNPNQPTFNIVRDREIQEGDERIEERKKESDVKDTVQAEKSVTATRI